MADKLTQKATQKGRGGTRERGPKGGTKPKCNTKKRKGAQEDRRKPQKERPKVEPRASKKRTQGAGRQREGATAGEKPKRGQPKVGTNPQRATRTTLETREMPRSLGETQKPQETKRVELWGHQKARTNENWEETWLKYGTTKGLGSAFMW